MTPPGFVDARRLPASPLDAAAHFHSTIVPAIREAIAGKADLVVAFAPASHTHDTWRLAAIQDLARDAAPARINAIVAGAVSAPDAAQTISFLHEAPGITGQILQVDGILGDKD